MLVRRKRLASHTSYTVDLNVYIIMGTKLGIFQTNILLEVSLAYSTTAVAIIIFYAIGEWS